MDLPFADWHQEAKLGEIVAGKIASQTKEIWAARKVTLLAREEWETGEVSDKTHGEQV
jgi:hypothetical protein